MPNLEMKNGARRWRACVMVNGVKRRKWFGDDSLESKRQASAWELNEKRDLERAQEEPTMTPSICSVHEWATRYLQDVKSRFSEVVLAEKVTAFRRLMQALQEQDLDPRHAPVSTLTAGIAAKHLKDQNDTRSGYAANKDRKNLVSGWTWGMRYLDSFPKDLNNPFAAVPKFREVRSPRYVPSIEDFWRVVEAAEGQDRVMLLAYLYLGARRKELFTLTWDDVDFSQERIRLWTNKREGGREFDWLPMAATLKQAFMQWKEATPFPGAPTVFVATWESSSPTHRPGEAFRSRQHLMARLCKRARVRKFTFHAIRHLTAVQLRRDGARLGLIQQVLRHRNPRTTEVYLRSLGLEMEEAREALAGLSFRSPGSAADA